MKTLSLVTSCPKASIVIADGDSILFEFESENQKTQSEVVHAALKRGFDETGLLPKDFDSFGVDIGPGRFTGVRIGLNIVKTFSYVFQKPIYTYDSLTLLAQGVPADLGARLICLINAFNNSVFLATFVRDANSWTVEKAPQVVAINDIEKHFSEPHVCVGDGFLTYEKMFSENLHSLFLRDPKIHDDPKARSLAHLLKSANPTQTKDWNSCQPLYLKRSAAEEKFG